MVIGSKFLHLGQDFFFKSRISSTKSNRAHELNSNEGSLADCKNLY